MPKVRLEGSWVYGGVLYSPDEDGEAEVPKDVQDAIKSKGGDVKATKRSKADDSENSEE